MAGEVYFAISVTFIATLVEFYGVTYAQLISTVHDQFEHWFGIRRCISE